MNGKRLGSFPGADKARLERMLRSGATSNGSDWNSETASESNQNYQNYKNYNFNYR